MSRPAVYGGARVSSPGRLDARRPGPARAAEWDPLDGVPQEAVCVDTSHFDDDPLRGHGGTGENLFIAWPSMMSNISDISVAVYLHGWTAAEPTGAMLRDVVRASGLNPAPLGPSSDLVVAVPRGRKASDRVYDFPALTQDDGAGLQRLIDWVLRYFLKARFSPPRPKLRLYQVILIAHSGGGLTLEQLLRNNGRTRACNPDLVFAFNAFPFRTTGVEDWLRKRIAQEQPTNPWGAFRLVHNPSTREESRRLAALLPPPRPDDEYNRFRVEETNRPEADMPREYMTSLMWNPGSDIDLGYGAGGATALDAPRSASALRSDPAFIRAIDRSAVELINDPRIVRHFLQEVDWSQQQFKGRGPNTVESESLFNEMSMVVPERRVPFGIHYHDVDSVVQAVPQGDGAKLFPEALEAFVRMRDAARSDGVRLSIGSAWRSVARQRAAAARNPNPAAVAPGISAHNYGLAVDLFLSVQGLKITEISTYSMLNMLAMYRSPIYKWLAANAAAHGWFPYRREPWHWEYNPPGFKERFEGAAAVAQAAGEVVGDIDPRLYESSDFLGKIRILGDWLLHRSRFTFGVQNTTVFPHSAICHIRIRTASGSGGAGTGFYIGNNRILTVAHMFRIPGAPAVTGLEISPGKTSDMSTFAPFSVGIRDCFPHPRYTYPNPDFDLAVIRVSTPPPHGKYFEIEELRMSPASGIAVCGYAAEGSGIDPNRQHLDIDNIRDLNAESFTYAAQVRRGSSGGPAFHVQYGVPTAVGVQSVAGDPYVNTGCRLTDAKIAWIRSC